MPVLLAAVQASGLATDVAASDGAVRCLLTLTELSATLRAGSLADAAHQLSVEGQLPAGSGRLTLSPERGIVGAMAALGELEVHDAIVDRAWVIRGDGPALLLALVPLLRPLAALAPHIEVREQLMLVRFSQPISLVELGERVRQALALWERAASFRLGAA